MVKSAAFWNMWFFFQLSQQPVMTIFWRRAAAHLNLLKVFFRLIYDSILYKKHVSHKNAIISFFVMVYSNLWPRLYIEIMSRKNGN